MSSMPVATRMAWNFAAVFIFGVLLIAGASYYELAVEPSAGEPVMKGVEEIAAETAVLVALLSLLGWWLARRALRPVVLLAAAADRIHEGNLSEKIFLPGSGAEFEKLAEVFNSMTARLDTSFQRVRQFTLNASHELKTPLSILHAEFERMAEDPGRSEVDQANFTRHLDEIVRLAQIVDGLAFLAKADADLVPVKFESVSMRPLILSAAEDTAALGAGSGITVEADPCDDVVWQGDRHRLRQLLVILCDNAVKYNRQDGTVRLSLEAHQDQSVLRVTNTGPGIPQADHEKVFQRFFRGASAMADGVEGCGLGLSIAHWIVAQHHGIFSFHSEPDRTEFTVTIRATAVS